jgi:hypothetical protein
MPIKEKNPLLMAVCFSCGVKFFFDRPAGADRRGIVSIRTHHQSPGDDGNSEIVPFTCLRCCQPLFIEVRYE